MDYDVVVKEVPPEHAASVRGTHPIAQMAEVMPKEFGRVMAALTAEGVQPSGGAVAIYHGWTEETVDVEIAFTIHGVFFPRDLKKGSVKASRVPGGKVAFTVHVGPYEQIAAAYAAIQAYARANRRCTCSTSEAYPNCRQRSVMAGTSSGLARRTVVGAIDSIRAASTPQ